MSLTSTYYNIVSLGDEIRKLDPRSWHNPHTFSELGNYRNLKQAELNGPYVDKWIEVTDGEYGDGRWVSVPRDEEGEKNLIKLINKTDEFIELNKKFAKLFAVEYRSQLEEDAKGNPLVRICFWGARRETLNERLSAVGICMNSERGRTRVVWEKTFLQSEKKS